ncbi:MAG: hypothetical protein IJB65_03005 [Clostridia bacterium]|nr:hypothetical protein [Clostridia bacterium]
MNFITKITSGVKIATAALNYSAVDESAILVNVRNWLCGVILVIGVIYGGYELFQGWIDDQPSKRKHGITILVVGISIPALIYGIINLVVASE